VSIRTLRARLEHLGARAGGRYIIGQDRHRDRKRREELRRLKLSPGLTNAQAAEVAELDAAFELEVEITVVNGNSGTKIKFGRRRPHRRGADRVH